MSFVIESKKKSPFGHSCFRFGRTCSLTCNLKKWRASVGDQGRASVLAILQKKKHLENADLWRVPRRLETAVGSRVSERRNFLQDLRRAPRMQFFP